MGFILNGSNTETITNKKFTVNIYVEYDGVRKKLTMNIKQLLGILGSAILFIGVFLPILSLPIVGNINYFRNGEGDGVFVLVLAVLSLILTITKNYKFLWATGGGSIGMMLFTYYTFYSEMSKQRASLETDLAGNPFKGLAEAMMQSVQVQWGVAVMIIGAALILAAAIIKNDTQIILQSSEKLSQETGSEVIPEPIAVQKITKPIASPDWKNIGKQHLKKQEFKEAVAALSYALNGEPNNGTIYYARAVAYSKLADNHKSIEDIKTAARLGHPKAVEYLQKKNG